MKINIDESGFFTIMLNNTDVVTVAFVNSVLNEVFNIFYCRQVVGTVGRRGIFFVKTDFDSEVNFFLCGFPSIKISCKSRIIALIVPVVIVHPLSVIKMDVYTAYNSVLGNIGEYFHIRNGIQKRFVEVCNRNIRGPVTFIHFYLFITENRTVIIIR